MGDPLDGRAGPSATVTDAAPETRHEMSAFDNEEIRIEVRIFEGDMYHAQLFCDAYAPEDRARIGIELPTISKRAFSVK